MVSLMMKKLAKSLLGGVVVQALIFVVIVLEATLLPRNPEGPVQSLEEYTYIAFIFSSPGLMIFAPYASARNPHPPFSDLGLLLGITVNILVYSSIVYLAATLWRNLKARLTKPT